METMLACWLLVADRLAAGWVAAGCWLVGWLLAGWLTDWLMALAG